MIFRQKYLVDGRQLRFCLKVLALGLIPSVMATLSILFVFWRLSGNEYIEFLSRNPVLVVEYLQRTMTHILLSFLALNSVVLFTVLLVFSNRIFGPVYNLKLRISKYLKGERSGALRFRRGDEFSDLAEMMNKTEIFKDVKAP